MSAGDRLDNIVEYFWHNRVRVIIDLAVAFVVVFGGATVITWLGWPEWALYVILVAAIIFYVVLMPPWDRPE